MGLNLFSLPRSFLPPCKFTINFFVFIRLQLPPNPPRSYPRCSKMCQLTFVILFSFQIQIQNLYFVFIRLQSASRLWQHRHRVPKSLSPSQRQLHHLHLRPDDLVLPCGLNPARHPLNLDHFETFEVFETKKQFLDNRDVLHRSDLLPRLSKDPEALPNKSNFGCLVLSICFDFYRNLFG